MIVAGIAIMTLAAITTTVAIVMEVVSHEPRWMILMKIGALLLGIGGVLFGVALGGSG